MTIEQPSKAKPLENKKTEDHTGTYPLKSLKALNKSKLPANHL